MTKQELLTLINLNKKPPHIRKGQYIFNWIDKHCQYSVRDDAFNKNTYSSIARDVQFIDKIDCFYNDSKIDEFLDACVKRINKL